MIFRVYIKSYIHKYTCLVTTCMHARATEPTRNQLSGSRVRVSNIAFSSFLENTRPLKYYQYQLLCLEVFSSFLRDSGADDINTGARAKVASLEETWLTCDQALVRFSWQEKRPQRTEKIRAMLKLGLIAG